MSTSATSPHRVTHHIVSPFPITQYATPTPSAATTQCGNCAAYTIAACVITAIVTALLAAIIFVLVQIAVRRCHPKFTPAGVEISPPLLAGEGEGLGYRLMDEGGEEEGGEGSDLTYMNVGTEARRFGSEVELKDNEAYGTSNTL